MLSVRTLMLTLMASQSLASVILLTSSSPSVKRGLTDTLNLYCSLNDTAASSNLIGRRSANGSATTQTADDVAEVSSFVMTLNGKDVASFSHSSPAHVLDGSTNAHASGRFTGSTGFMALTIENPTDAQTGDFLCEVNAISTDGHSVSFSRSVEVGVMDPSVGDLVQAIKDLKNDKQQLTARVTSLEKKSETSVFFSAGISSAFPLTKRQTVVYDRVFSNFGNGYDPSSGVFTCPISGSYLFTINALAVQTFGFGLSLRKNGQYYPISVYGHFSNTIPGHSVSVILPLVKGDKIDVNSVSDQKQQLRPNYNVFSGHLIYFQ